MAFTLVQNVGIGTSGVVSTFTKAWSVGPTAGNLIVVVCWAFGSNASALLGAGTVTDNKGNTFSLAKTVQQVTSVESVAIHYLIAPATYTGYSVTVSPTGSSFYHINLTCTEFNTGGATPAVDVSASNTGASPAQPTSGTTGTTNANCALWIAGLVMGEGFTQSSISTPTGFTDAGKQLTGAGNQAPGSGSYAITGTLASVAASAAWTVASTTQFGAVIATFKTSAITLTFEGDGTLTPGGVLSKASTKLLSGTLSPTGSLNGAITHSLTRNGTLTPTGSLGIVINRTFSGTLTPSGALVKLASHSFEGTLTPSGDLTTSFPDETARVSQYALEAARIGIGNARVSQLAIETALIPSTQNARVSQYAVEIAFALPPAPLVLYPCSPLTEFVRSWVNLYDTSGNVVAVFDDWKTLDITHTLNSYSTAILTLDNLDPRAQLFALDSILEVWRSIGPFKYVEYVGFHRVGQQDLTEDQHSIFTSISRGLLDLVHRRFVLYPTVTAFTLKSAPGETVIKQIVNENVGPGAYNPPRYQSGITPGFSLQPDTAQGVVWAGQIANDNVLKVIGDIATFSSVDYDVIRTSPITFEFRTYYPQRGVDRSAYLAFAPELGNMVAPKYTLASDEEVNVFAVLGPGQDSSRRVLPVQGTDLGASPWNQVEGTVSDASADSTYESMLAAGQTAIANAAPKETFTFNVLQVDNAAYGRDYIVGDYVTARFGTISRRKKIIGATVGIREGVEIIKLTFSDIP